MALNFLAVKVERETVDNNLIYENPKLPVTSTLMGIYVQ